MQEGKLAFRNIQLPADYQNQCALLQFFAPVPEKNPARMKSHHFTVYIMSSGNMSEISR